MKGEKFLKVTGILMIIGGSISILLGIIAVVGVGALAALLGEEAGDATLLYISAAFVLISGIFELVAGIMGVKYCAKQEKAVTCLVMGIITAVLCVVGQIIGVAAGSSINILSLILGLTLPVLYIIGAVMNKNSVVE